MRGMDQLLFILFCLFLCFGITKSITVNFDRQHVEYVAFEYNDAGEPIEFRFPSRQAAHVAVDKRRKLLYAMGGQRFSVFKIFRNNTLDLVHTEKVQGMLYTSIRTCKGFVTVTARAAPDLDLINNWLFVFSGYKKRFMGKMPKPHAIQVGAWPVDHVLTRNCRKAIVASRISSTIEIITFSDSYFRKPSVKSLGFGEFDNPADEERLDEQWFVTDPNEDFEKAIRPTRLCLNTKETKVYVSLNENNGVAVVDLKPRQERIGQLIGLGLKDWSEDGATDGLDGIDDVIADVVNAPIFSTYSPAQISYQKIGNQDCIFVAGSGTGLDITVTQLNLDPLIFSEAFSTEYGDLRVFDDPRTDPDTDTLDELVVSSGTRDFSLFCGSPLSLVTDTGSDLELRTLDSLLFNSAPISEATLEGGFDLRSKISGPEPISVITKKICRGRYILMIGATSHPGHLYIYTLDTGNIQAGFQFQDMIDGYIREDSEFTDEELYDMRLLSLRGVMGMSFVTGVRPGGRLMFVSSSEATGTVELFELRVNCKAEQILE